MSAEPGDAATGDWPLPARDLAATRAGGPLAGTEVRWSVRFPGGVPATAASAGGTVFAASAAGAVAAVTLSGGEELWRRELGTARYGSGERVSELGFFGGVAVASGVVVVAGDRVHALDAATGATRWESPPLRGLDGASDDYCWGLPVIAGGLVLVGSGSGSQQPIARGRLSAFRLADGALAWSTPLVPPGGNGGSVIGPVSVDLATKEVFVATGSPYAAVAGPNPGTCSLLVLALGDGTIIWQDQVHAGDTRGLDFSGAPVLVGERLFAVNKDGVYAWDRLSRARLWQRQVADPLAGGAESAAPTGGPEGGPLATDGTRLYTLANDRVGGGCVAAALAPADGELLWSTTLPAPSFAAPALAGDRLCVSGADGTVRVLDTASGALVASAALGAPSAAAPLVAGGRLVVGTGAAPYLPGDALVCVG